MIKKITLGFTITVLTILFFGANANTYSQSAQVNEVTTDLIYPYPGPDYNTGFLGEDHKYSVHLRDNGEAVVTAKFSFVNNSEVDQTIYELSTDGEDLSDIIAYQINSGPRPGFEYQVVGGIEAWKRRYMAAEVKYEGKKLTINLPQTIAPDRQGSVFLYFRTYDFVDTGLFGGHEYEFESFASPNLIDKLTVGITVDSDIYLKEAKGQVDYSQPDAARLAISSSSELAGAQLDQIVGNIGYGQITKTASSLNRGETFEVEGEYASSQLVLYLQEILITLAVLIFLFVVIAWLAKRMQGKKGAMPLLVSFVAAFTSALGIGVATVLFYIFFQVLSNQYIYGVSGLSIVIGIIAFLVYAALFIAPSVFVGIKYGVGWALTTLIGTIVMLGLLTFMGLVVLGAKRFSVLPYYPFSARIEKSIPVPLINE